MMKPIVLFYHVEKCGGTSLIASSRMRSGLKHCDLVLKNKFSNMASICDLKRGIRYYPNADFIAGHCLNPSLIDDYTAYLKDHHKRRAIHITLVRNPLLRILSDYTHDCKRRGSEIPFAEYLQIEWKHNYLTQFFGAGNIDNAKTSLAKMHIASDIGDEGTIRHRLAQEHNIRLLDSVQTNQSSGAMPASVSLKNGVKIGKYTISKNDAALLNANCKLDRELVARINSEGKTPNKASKIADDMHERATRSGLNRIFRNYIYKPFGCQRIGLTVLPRNAFAAQDVHFDGTTSIWSDQK